MTSPHIEAADDGTLEKNDEARARTLLHLRLLLRVKNRLCSPLLQLPTEIIIRILSFTNGGYHRDWQSTFSTCHRIYMIMRKATEVWWEVNYNFTTASLRAAHISFMRSKGNPRVLVADIDPWDSMMSTGVESFHDYWMVNRVFQSSELHTLEFSGDSTTFDHFSWIPKGPLPNLECLKIHILPALDIAGFPIPIPNPFALQLSPDIQLRVLDLHNVTRPWLPTYFTGLRELHLRFKHCSEDVAMLEDELLGILNASPRLECLSLARIRVGDDQRHQPKRIVQLPNLTSLLLANNPEVVGYILALMDIPAIASLDIIANISDGDATRALGLLFPDDRLPKRLFSDPPVFKIGPRNTRREMPYMGFNIGSFKIQFESDRYSNLGQNAFVACIPLVPSSVTTLQADFSEFDQQVWREFFRLHPEVRSIGCYDTGVQYKSLWEALSPVRGGDPVILCPGLESIHLKVAARISHLVPLLTCLRHRNRARFKLRHLSIDDNGKSGEADMMAEDFGPLVEVLDVKFPPIEEQRVSPVSMHDADVCSSTPSGATIRFHTTMSRSRTLV